MAEVVTQQREKAREQTPVDQLVAFLRAHPYKLNHNKAELAEKFGLDVEFVADVLETLKGSPNRLSPFEAVIKIGQITWQNISHTWQNVWKFLKWIWSELTEKPYATIPLTIILTSAIILILRLLAPFVEPIATSLTTTIITLVVSMGFLHILCYLRHGMMRYVFFGTGVFACVLLPLTYYIYVTSDPIYVAGRLTSVSEVIAAAFVLILSYFGGMSIFSLYGGYQRTLNADVKEKRLSRQQLLDRLFELEEEMEKSSGEGNFKRGTSVISVIRNSPWLPLLGLVAGACIGFFEVLVTRGSDSVDDVSQSILQLLMAIKAAGYLGVGYLTGSFRKSVIVLSLMFAGMLLPIIYFGYQDISEVVDNGPLLIGLLVMLFFGVISSIGAHIDERARVRRKLAENDPAHVVAEMVELQWRLNPTAEASCVVSVDVAGSTALKADADPFMVEYSFRAYQDFLSEITKKRGGIVLSTAGDGAILNFQSCAEALYASKEIQSEIGKFNSRSNRLRSAFRVRIGIHTGEVTAQLADVPFNELIDIAAHVERESPVGGIAVTQSVVDHLEEERIAALQEKVDGQTVYFVLNPTFSA